VECKTGEQGPDDECHEVVTLAGVDGGVDGLTCKGVGRIQFLMVLNHVLSQIVISDTFFSVGLLVVPHGGRGLI